MVNKHSLGHSLMLSVVLVKFLGCSLPHFWKRLVCWRIFSLSLDQYKKNMADIFIIIIEEDI